MTAGQRRSIMDRPGALSVISVAVLTLAALAGWFTADHGGSAPTPPDRTLAFFVGGDVLSVTALYHDATGEQLAASVGGPIEVSGLEYAAVAVTGVGVSCSITYDGLPRVTHTADPTGEPVTVQCVYAPAIQDVSTV